MVSMIRKNPFRILGILMLSVLLFCGGLWLFLRWQWRHTWTTQLTPILEWQTSGYGGRMIGSTFDVPDSRVRDLTIDPTGTWLAAGCSKHRVCVWTLADAHFLGTLEPPRRDDSAFIFRFGPQPAQIQVVQADQIAVWDVPSLTRTRQDVLHPFPSAASPDGSTAISPHGTYIAKSTRAAQSPHAAIVYLWDGRTGAPLITLTEHTNEVTSLVFSPNEQLLATASYDRTIRIWQLPEGRLLHTMEVIGESTLAFSPDGTLLASGDGQEAGSEADIRGNSYIFLWDTRTGERVGAAEIMHPGEYGGFINQVRFSMTGQVLGSADSGGQIHVWRLSPLP